MSMNSLIGAFESTVSSNAHILQQFIALTFQILFLFRLRSSLFERVRYVLRLSVKSLIQLILILKDYLKEYLLLEAASGDVAQALYLF